MNNSMQLSLPVATTPGQQGGEPRRRLETYLDIPKSLLEEKGLDSHNKVKNLQPPQVSAEPPVQILAEGQNNDGSLRHTVTSTVAARPSHRRSPARVYGSTMSRKTRRPMFKYHTSPAPRIYDDGCNDYHEDVIFLSIPNLFDKDDDGMRS